MIRALAVEEFIPQEREAEDADHGRRESVRLLGHEILRPLILPDGKARHACAGSGDRIELRAVTEHVAEVQDVGMLQDSGRAAIRIDRVLAHDLGGL